MTSDKVCMRQMFHITMVSMLRPLRVSLYDRRDRQKEKGSEIDASPQLPISTGVQSLDQSWSVPLDQSRFAQRSAIMVAQVQSTDVCLCYQRLRASCTLCNNFQAARPRQTTSFKSYVGLVIHFYIVGIVLYESLLVSLPEKVQQGRKTPGQVSV